MKIPAWVLAIAIGSATSASATGPDWSEGARVPLTGRTNPYSLSPPEYEAAVRAGRLHALRYPVTVTSAVVPYLPIKNLVEAPDGDPRRALLERLSPTFKDWRSMDDVSDWIGLHPYPKESDSGVYSVPYPDGRRPSERMGFTIVERHGAQAFTFSCAACHSSSLFGKQVLGLTNRFAHANEFFIKGKEATAVVPGWTFAAGTGASLEETRVYDELAETAHSIGAVAPRALGLDTSLAQVALSLARRETDDMASLSPWYSRFPRPEPLETHVADSKPAVWWNVKYKNRWLSDGSVVSGNPIYTNILWNEIGRGTDLRELGDWISGNAKVIRDLATAVFSAQPPRYTDFFPATSISLDKARRGEAHFKNRCAGCHGNYDKAWSLPGADALPLEKRLETLEVRYHDVTPVVDVGTDPGRRLGMASLERGLNPLRFSRDQRIVIRQQPGYVPPPLVGIWARWPYFHNNSVPSLCAVLTRAADRPKTYAAVAANDEQDFDRECNGYPAQVTKPVMTYDTSKPGLSNSGHDERIFLDHGKEIFTPEQKHELIEFLKTL